MADAAKRIAEMNAKRAAKPERIVSMSQYGDVADKRWFARMSGKLWQLTEMAKEEKVKRRKAK